MKIDLCKLFNVEEGEEFKIEHISCEGLIYKIQDNCLKRRQQDSKNFTNSGFGINKINEITNIIKLPKKKEFTDDELYILDNIDKKYKWIAKDKNGLICTFVSKPIKTEKLWSDGWSNGESYASLEAIKNSLFKEIKWEDEEPVYIDDYVDRK